MSQDRELPQDAHADVLMIENPPQRLTGILQRLGPGLIIAGSIVGSGELIGTTKTGAEAGFWLLWLIVIGCVIKVFVQVELGRYSLTSGKTTMDALSEVPGPAWQGRGNWLIWFWALVFIATIGQVGGIVGGVGQAMSISVPLTEQGFRYNEQVELETQYKVARSELRLAQERAAAGDPRGSERESELQAKVARLGEAYYQARLATGKRAAAELRAKQPEAVDVASWSMQVALQEEAAALIEQRRATLGPFPEKLFAPVSSGGPAAALDKVLIQFGRLETFDDEIWAILMAIITSTLLVLGRYGLIQSFSAVLVASFTLVTVVNVVMLQRNYYWSIGWTDLVDGFRFQLPPAGSGASRETSVATALATFGIIGVGTNELLAYPYWCLEKGYARFTGPRDDSPAWAERARGWMRVMQWDAWCSMVVYTFATVAFYLLGAAILGRTGLNPEGSEMIRTLGVMYEPVFGTVARWVFLFGAFAVLYSTYFVASASLARIVPDGLRVMGTGPRTEAAYQTWIRAVSGIFPFLCVIAYCFFGSPALMVLIGGVMQGLMLPMLATAALFFRYRRSDPRIAPGRLWTICLWISAFGLLVTGLWTAWSELTKFFPGIPAWLS
jgi:Mn2+/Fe2+ NRAMP family transporter